MYRATVEQRYQYNRMTSAARRAFEGFTGPLDKVQAGDFQAVLDLLRKAHFGLPTTGESAAIGDFLARLSPTEDSSHD